MEIFAVLLIEWTSPSPRTESLVQDKVNILCDAVGHAVDNLTEGLHDVNEF